jgi:hypothetical protein
MNPLNESPNQPNEPPKQPSSIPRPVDVWPAPQSTFGDVEPSTQPTPTPYQQPATQPVDATQPTTETTSAPTAAPLSFKDRQDKKKPLVIALIIALVLIILGAIGAGAYAWYQAPQKVVTDSIAQLLTAKKVTYTGTIDTNSEASKLAVALDGAATNQMVSGHAKATISMGAASVVAEGNLISDKDGNLYIKIVNAKDIATTLLQGLPAEMQPTINTAIDKINNKWIKLTPADLNTTQSTDAAKVQQCYRTAFDKFQNDAQYRSDVVDQYSKNQFIAIKQNLGEKSGSLGYKLAVDATKEKAFVDGVVHTKIYADLQKCDSSFKLDSSQINKDTTGSTAPDVELWVEKWSHTITKLAVMSPASEKTDTYNITLNPKFDQNVSIDVPKDAMTLDQLKAELSPLFGGMFGEATDVVPASVAVNSTTLRNQTNAITLQKKVEVYNAVSATGGYPTFTQIMNATGEAQLSSDIKSLIVSHTASTGGQIGFVPCAKAANGGTISYIDAATEKVQTITYGSC